MNGNYYSYYAECETKLWQVKYLIKSNTGSNPDLMNSKFDVNSASLVTGSVALAKRPL